MMAWWMSTITLAAPAQPELHQAVEALYKRQLPEEAICVEAPGELPGRFRDATAVGVRRGARGCVLIGVMIGETLHAPESAASAALDQEAWGRVDARQRASDLSAWTRRILLAFDQALGESTQQATGGGFTIEQRYLRRTDTAGATTQSLGTWSFDASGELLDHRASPESHHKTTLSVRSDRLTGTLTSELVEAALFEQGRAIKDCFTTAWEHDLTLDGRVRLAWTVQEGKATDLSVIEDGQPLSMDLARCYASVVRRLEFPEDATGTVRWIFATTRSDTEAP
ncbi:MAG TPA: hypothetical protein ENK18_07140 [Deltaproteobacteria bacterium]|nr:hypothetical protein [Deltaproteobacteria bacterium]